MDSSDLPVELWSMVASYLTRSDLHKMIGFNRAFFNIVMDDLYQEIRFTSNDLRTRELFEKVTLEPRNALRVRSLVIRPDFLPGLEEVSPQERLYYCPYQCPVPFGELYSRGDDVFLAALGAIRLCSNLKEVEVVLHDHRWTPSFDRFLSSLWKDPVAARLRSLSINTTWTKTPRFLQHLVEFSDTLMSLQEFDLEISPSRVEHDEAITVLAVRSLESVLRAFNGQLTALRLSSPYFEEIAISLGSIPHLPKLEKLEIFAFFGMDPRQFKGLTRFIASHEDTLRHLLLKPRPRYHLGRVVHPGYSNWLNPQADDEELKAFRKPLRKLETLHLGLCGGPEDEDFWVSKDSLTSRVIPNFSTFVPNITSLVLNCLPLTLARISDLVDGLEVDTAGRRQLRSLRATLLPTSALSASLFDMFALKLDSLKSLAITYRWPLDVDGSPDIETIEEAFYREMEEKRYDRWELEVLRLTKPEACPTPHPDMTLMEAVATSFRRKPQLDHSYICSC